MPYDNIKSHTKNEGFKHIKTTQKNCCKSVSSISKDSDPRNGIKMQQKLVFEFLLPLVIYLSGFHLLNVSYFSQNFVMTSLDILFSGPS